ncbi:oxidoreductase, FAD-binding [Sulfuricella denitrificans skB26]|uniref:Oxidoreductase, FAD-binding n=1 Tax=Sulfuricella denitrificans (strain DSM 22764 / NBRC 105220 / skB26) TaxID=1163617 RepID=S6AJL5_SULDS|nr:NAD(P)/FAD-dependent oxidoreductase [Sulfuricella denitrificans]BAN36551.1 oxidoreductase, FAD-binding [Sulfuricella denitrificans skB26]
MITPPAASNTRASCCDVLVIGGGPAGSTAAALLAERGYRVTLLEKAHHPRFHIGESLLPANLPLLEKLGVAEAVKAIGMEKWGAEFVSPWHDHIQSFEFADAMDKSMPMAYQVRRSEFDEILIRNASRKNARVVEGCQVQDVDFLPDNAGALVQARHEDGSIETVQTRFVLDASGRDTFLGNRFKAKQRNKKHNSTAVYAHFSGVERNSGKAAGNITIFWFEHGWFWLIPLADGTTSVGAVTWPYYLKTRNKKSLAQFFQETIAMCAPLSARLQHAQLTSPVEATGNFSYMCDHSHGNNYLLLGDAYGFIDPVFSSGVMLAMNSAFVGADTVDICLSHPQRAAAALKKFDAAMRIGPKEFSWFIYRVTNPTMRNMFMEPRNIFRVKEALLSVLAGDVFGKTPIHGPLRIFKGLYYMASLLNFKRTLKAWQMRKHNIRIVDETGSAMN